MLFHTGLFCTSPPALRNLPCPPLRPFSSDEFSYLTTAELPKCYHYRLLLHARLKLPAFPFLHCPDRDTCKNRQFLLGDTTIPKKAPDQTGRETRHLYLFRGCLQWDLSFF